VPVPTPGGPLGTEYAAPELETSEQRGSGNAFGLADVLVFLLATLNLLLLRVRQAVVR
jgi:hypothetical protein